MARKIAIASLALAWALALALPASAEAQAGNTPNSTALCLPPGATAPVACGSARAGQTIRLRIATTSLPTAPIQLVFTEEVAGGQPARTASLTIAPERSRDGAYDVTVPRELCGRPGQAQFEIQHLMSTFNQSETTSRPLGSLTVAC
jgi:hypothetical protein